MVYLICKCSRRFDSKQETYRLEWQKEQKVITCSDCLEKQGMMGCRIIDNKVVDYNN